MGDKAMRGRIALPKVLRAKAKVHAKFAQALGMRTACPPCAGVPASL
jgi:hypothetical protein